MTREEITKLFYDKCSVRKGKAIVLLGDDVEVIVNFIARMFEHLNKKLADLNKENEWLSQFTMNCKLHENDLLKEFVKCISYSLINDDRVEYGEYIKIMAVIRQDLEDFLEAKRCR